jgi:hypothetical protein
MTMATFAVIIEGVVTNIVHGEFVDLSPIFGGSLLETPRPDGTHAVIGGTYDPATDSFPVPPAPPPTPEEIQAAFTAQIQQRLDNFAQTRGYDDILSACTYATSTVEKFQREGQYCVEARDATWAAAYAFLDDVLVGEQVIPGSIDDIVSLPVLRWPE